MKYLLDTSILSELMKETPDPAVIRWIREHDADTALCSIVMAEIAAGIEKMADGKRKSALLKELRFIIEDHSERTLAFD